MTGAQLTVLAVAAQDPPSKLLSVGLIAFGSLILHIMLRIHRSSRDHLPDDGHVAAWWASVGLEPMGTVPDEVRDAADQLALKVSTSGGSRVLGLPGDRGVRLIARTLAHERTMFVADTWAVTSVSYTDDRTTSATVELRAIAVVRLPRRYPMVLVAPEDAWGQLRDAAGLRDLQFEGDAFNRRWRVRGEDPQFAHAVVTARLMAALEDAGARFAVEVCGDLVTVLEVRGPDGRPGGQASSGPALLAIAEAFVTTVRTDAWPEAPQTPEKRRRQRTIAFDPRPPGAEHPAPTQRDRMVSAAVGLGVPAMFVLVGLYMLLFL